MTTASSSNIIGHVFHSLSSVKTSEPWSIIDTARPSSLLSLLKDDCLGTAKTALLTLHFLFPHELLPALDLLDRTLVKRLQYCEAPDPETTRTRRLFTDVDLMRGPGVDLRSVQQQSMISEVSPSHQTCINVAKLEIFYVQSASATQGRGQAGGRFRNAWRGNATKMYYEVRLDSWNCSCSAFAQSQLKVLLQEAASTHTKSLLPTDINKSNGSVQVRASGLEADVVEAEKHEDERQFVFGGLLTKPEMPVPICKHLLAAAIATAAPDIFAKDTEDMDANLEEFSGWAAGWGEI